MAPLRDLLLLLSLSSSLMSPRPSSAEIRANFVPGRSCGHDEPIRVYDGSVGEGDELGKKRRSKPRRRMEDFDRKPVLGRSLILYPSSNTRNKLVKGNYCARYRMFSFG